MVNYRLALENEKGHTLMATWFGLSWLFGKRGAARGNDSAGAGDSASAAVEPLETRCLLSAAAPAVAATDPTISFTAVQRFENTSAFTGYIATGDFTGNGLTDFASTRGSANNIYIYLNNGNNTFTRAAVYHVNDPRGIVAGDFNNDGITDLAVVAQNDNNGTNNNTSAQVDILYGLGNGLFSTPKKIVNTRQGFGAIAAADFTNNGQLDLAVTNNRAVSIYMNQGNGTFAGAIRYNTGIGNAAYVSAEDLTGDGVPDLVVGKGEEAFVSVLLGQTINGQATGVFEPFTKYPTKNLPISVTVGDLTGAGGLPDIVTANNGFRQGISVLMNNGDGTFSPQTVYQGGNFPRYVALGDFGGNGEVDVAETDFDGPLYVFPNDGDGTLGTPQLFGAGRQGDYLIPINLGTGDGPESLLVSHSGDISVLVNTTPVTT
jgi:FG-GAP-like repeat